MNGLAGDWFSFEHLINNHDPNLTGLGRIRRKPCRRGNTVRAIMMLGDARRPAASLQNLGQGVAIPHWWMALSSSRPQLATMMMSQALT